MSVEDNLNNNNVAPSVNSSNSRHQSLSNQNAGRSRNNQQNDRQHNNMRRSSNYNSNRNSNRGRYQNDSSSINNTGIGSNLNRENSNLTGNNRNYNSRNNATRYESGHNYGHNTRNYEPRNNQPQLTQSLLNSMDEFPSLDGSAVQPIVSQLDNSYVSSSTQTSSNLHIGDLSNNFDSNLSTNSNQYQSGLFTQHQQPNVLHHQNRQYNTRRGGNNYNKNNNQRDYSNSGRNYNRQSNVSNTANTSHQNYNMNNQMNQSNYTNQANNLNQANHGNQHGSGMRSRNNRRGNNSNYDQNRRQNNRDYNQLPNMMNGMRIGVNHAVASANMNPMQFPYMSAPYPPPILAPIPAGIPSQIINPSMIKDQNINNQVLIGNPSDFLPAITPQDIMEAEEYKTLTSDPGLTRSEIIQYQIEYYFCNFNLRNDAFLRGQMDHEGWVRVSTISKFNRVAKFDFSEMEVETILANSTKLETKRDSEKHVFIRRTNEPERWVNKVQQPPSNVTDNQTNQMNQMNQMNQINHMNGIPHLQPIPIPVSMRNYPPSPYIGNFIHPSQLPMNYGVYPMEDINSQYGVVFDPNAYQETVQNSYENQFDYENDSPTLETSPQFESQQTQLNDDDTQVQNANDERTTYISSQNIGNNEELNTVDLELNDEEYKELLKKFMNSRKNDSSAETDLSVSNKIYRYWTHNLVLKFDSTKYETFRKCAIEDAKNQKRDGMNMLCQFYERFLHRYPFLMNQKTDESQLQNDISQRVFDDFQQDAYNDYQNNECIVCLTKLIRFNNQFTNPSRQTPSLKSHIQQLIDTLGLTELSSANNNDVKKRQNNDTLTDDMSFSSSLNIPANKETTSTHH